jgi:hypothetical protein
LGAGVTGCFLLRWVLAVAEAGLADLFFMQFIPA